jgi:hypothetical protein
VDVIIRANHTVTVDSPGGTCKSMTVGDTGTGSPATLNFQAGQTLTVSTTLAVGNAPSNGTLDMTAAGCGLVCPNLTFTAGFYAINGLNISGGTTAFLNDGSISGQLNIANGAGLTDNGHSFTVTGNATIDGSIAFSGGASGNFQSIILVSNTGSFTDSGSGIIHHFQNGLTVNGTFQDVAGSTTYFFDTNDQAFNGMATIPKITVGSGKMLTNMGNLTVTSIDGSLTSEHFIQNAGANLNISGAFGATTAINIDLSAAGNTVTYSGGTVPTPQAVDSNTPSYSNLNITGITELTGATTVSGTLTVASGSILTNPATSLTVMGTTTIDGTFAHMDGAATFNGAVIVSATGSMAWQFVSDGLFATFVGPVTINGTWDDQGPVASPFSPEFQGGLTVSTGATFSVFPDVGTYTFDTADQTFSGGATMYNVTVGSGKTLTNNGNLTIVNDLCGSLGTETFKQGPSSILNIGHAIGSSCAISIDASAIPNSFNYNGTNTQTVVPANYNTLKISTTGASSAVQLGAGSINISGNLDTSAASPTLGWDGSGNTLVFNGNTPQKIIGGPSTLVDANDVTLANPTGVTLSGQDFMVAGKLQFGMGNLNTGTFNLQRDSTAVPAPTSVGASASSHIVGNEAVFFGSGSGQSYTFSVGDATALAAVTVSNFNVTTAGTLIVTTVAGNEPHIATSGLDPTRTAARFWKLFSPAGIVGTLDAMFNFNAADVTAGNPASFVAMRFNGTTWSPATVSALNSASTVVKGIDTTLLGAFQLGQIAGPQPILGSGGITITGENVVGQQLTFTGVATDPSGFPLTYNWDFGDGMTASGALVQHVYNVGGDFTINLTVTNGGSSTTLQIPISIFAPATGAEGVTNIGLDDPPVTNVFNGISISVDFSDGGIIGLTIDINALIRSAFNVSTDFSGTGGSLGTRAGLNPIMQFTNSGVFVATTSATDAATNTVAGKARKTLAVGDKELGKTPKYKNEPKSPKIKTGKIGGKFSFSRSGAASTGKSDVVAYTGTFELPEGLDLTSKPTFAFSIGNIVDSITVDAKGKGISPSASGFIKKVQVKFPKLPKGTTVTSAGQMGTFQVNIAGVDLSSKGFDTEGIQGSVLASEKSLKTVPRSIQIAMVFGGAAYDATADVSFKLGTGGTSGAIGTRH